MKKLILSMCLAASTAHAVPVLNQNMAADGTNIVIWPDHENPDHFYYAPSIVHLAKRASEVKFHLMKYRTGCTVVGIGCRTKAMINALLVADYHSDLEKAQQGIRRLRPQARFSTIPMFDGKVKFPPTVKAFIDQHDCSPNSGQPVDEIPCSLTLNKRGIRNLVPFLAEGKVMAFQFTYRIEGVNSYPGTGFRVASTPYGVAVALGGEELRHHIDLE